MSTRTLTYTEYNRLTTQANRAAEAERRAERERRANAELRNRIETMRNQQVSHSATVGNLASANETLRNQLNQANQRLRESGNMGELHQCHLSEMNQRIEEMNRQAREERDRDEAFRNSVRSQFGAINVALGDIRQGMERQNESIQDMVNQMTRDREEMNRRSRSERERAVQTLEELRRYLADLKPLEIERFFPGVYGMLEAYANAAQENIENGDLQAALAAAQSGCVMASDAYVRGQVLHQAFEERVAEIREIAGHARELIESSERSVTADIAERASELEDGCPAEARKPDYWNDGAFAQLRRRRDQIDQTLANVRNTAWTFEDLEHARREVMEIENQTLDAADEAVRQVARYFDSMVGGIETILEVLGDGWECTRYEHSVPGNLTSPVQMVFRDGGGHELPMIMDISAAEPDKTRLDMAVVGAGVEDSGEDAQVTLDDITERLQEHGLRIGSCETDLDHCETVARTADTYFEDRRRRARQAKVIQR